MAFFENLLRIMNTKMPVPTPYGWFHLLCFAVVIAVTVALCFWSRRRSSEDIRRMVLAVAVTVVILETYKQVNFSFGYEGGISFNYLWYAFPFQFCSTPMYIGLLAGLTRKGKLHDAACAYLATYAVFAGICVMFYPVTVFVDTVGINIQTMFCHGSMITIGACLLCSGHVKLEYKTILKALPVFISCVLLAMLMNEIAYRIGIPENDDFNMFFISPHSAPSLPVYSLVQAVVPYPFCLLIYIAGFTAAAFIILLASMGIRTLACKERI